MAYKVEDYGRQCEHRHDTNDIFRRFSLRVFNVKDIPEVQKAYNSRFSEHKCDHYDAGGAYLVQRQDIKILSSAPSRDRLS